MLLATLLLAVPALAHIEMIFPPPFKSKSNPYNGGDIDYSMTSPLDASGSNYPCKGYHSLVGSKEGSVVATFSPGAHHNLTLAGSAYHGGGSCQALLSYDGGHTFTVIESWIGNCAQPGGGTYDFIVPSDAPTGEALFAWTWFNNLGNREMYMNCAAITIAGSGSRKRGSDGFYSRPTNFIANVGNGCSTLEGKDVLFPNPGPDVQHESSNTADPLGSCGSGPGSGAGTTTETPTATPTNTKGTATPDATATPDGTTTRAEPTKATDSPNTTDTTNTDSPTTTAPIGGNLHATDGTATTTPAKPTTTKKCKKKALKVRRKMVHRRGHH